MTDLTDRIREVIRSNGPMPVSLYMLMCQHDPKHGYYAVRPGLGRDFATAPEISQMFGEMLGLWVAHEWRAMGAPSPFWLVELGPGRGVMMADMLRACATAQDVLTAARVVLVEASASLAKEQASRLSGRNVAHVADLASAPEGPAIVVANEFLDCFAIRQFVKDGSDWRERTIGLDDDNGLIFGLGVGVERLPDDAYAKGSEIEIAAGLDTVTQTLAQRFSAHPGRALFIDYGPKDFAPGDTLRAFRDGRQVGPLEQPGECDLTADVDFGRLLRLAEKARLTVHGPREQGGFLKELGLTERARALIRSNPGRLKEITAAETKLLSDAEMGSRFKAICLSSPGLPTPAGFFGTSP